MRRILPIIALCLWAAAARAQTVPVDSQASVMQQMRNVTVRVRAADTLGNGYGSGVVVSPHLVITNRHVVAGAGPTAYAVSYDNEHWTPAELAMVSKAGPDLAVVRIKGRFRHFATVARLTNGGYYSLAGFGTQGVWHVNRLRWHPRVQVSNSEQFGGEALHGDSGGPVFNERGEVVTVIWGDADDGTAYAVDQVAFRAIIVKALEGK